MTSNNTNDQEALTTEDRVGAIWQGKTGTSKPARFYWIDEESGERLELRVEGDEGFLQGLENLGFIRRTVLAEGGLAVTARTKSAAAEAQIGGATEETPRRKSDGASPHAGWHGRWGA